MRATTVILIFLLVGTDLVWNLTHLNIGLVDFYVLASFAHGLVAHGAWPATPYFPAGYPLLLVPAGLAGSALIGGYVLSAGGMALALWALYRLARLWGAAPAWALTAVVLGWLSPVCQVTAGSPSVDALYTGLGLWFLAAALALWLCRAPARDASAGAAALPRWALWGLYLPAAALPLLRYHAVVLLLPVLLVLLIWRRSAWRLVLPVLALTVLVVAFNQLSWRALYGEALPGVAALQVRTGIEHDTPQHYATPEELNRDYAALATRARTTPLSVDYSWAVIVQHTLHSWTYYLRRPAVVLAAAAVLLALVLRAPLPAGVLLSLLWLLGYTLALSPAYYTSRAALLPVLVALATLLAAVCALAERRAWRYAPLIAAVVLVGGNAVASRFVRADYTRRTTAAALLPRVDALVTEHGLAPDEVIALDGELFPRRDNPWTKTYAAFWRGWPDDPAIRPAQVAALVDYDLADVAAGRGKLPRMILCPKPRLSTEFAVLAESEYWQRAGELNSLVILLPRAPAVSASDASAPAGGAAAADPPPAGGASAP